MFENVFFSRDSKVTKVTINEKNGDGQIGSRGQEVPNLGEPRIQKLETMSLFVFFGPFYTLGEKSDVFPRTFQSSRF
jgi:hypothetical protein